MYSQSSHVSDLRTPPAPRGRLSSLSLKRDDVLGLDMLEKYLKFKPALSFLRMAQPLLPPTCLTCLFLQQMKTTLTGFVMRK